MRPFNLEQVFRPIFRRHMKAELDEWSEKIKGARPPKDGGKTGGSLARAVKRVGKLKRWGYVLRLHTLGQKLTWFVRGKKGQRPRPIEVETDVDALARELEQAAAQAFAHYDRRAGA